MTQPTSPPADAQPDAPPDVHPEVQQLRRTPRQKVVAGVCGGLGRYCDVDPVIFRIVIGVLSVTGGVGLIFYGFAWLLIPAEDEEENEARRLLSGRVEGASLTAVLLALIGCGLFLTMMSNGGTLSFAALLSLAVAGAAVWSQRRRVVAPDGAPLDPATAHAVAEAPPETKAPPVPDSPSWWRDPIIKDGTTGPVPTGYLWGPEGATAEEASPRPRRTYTAPPQVRGPRGIGGTVFLLALLAGGLGTVLSWDGHPMGTSLQIGLVGALGVFGLGLLVSSFLGRTGFGTVMMTMITAVLLAGAAAVPKDISTQWQRTNWKPASVAAVQPRYAHGSGIATLDLSSLTVPKGEKVRTTVELGAGQLKVVVPKEAPVVLHAEAGLGDISLPDDAANDIDVSPEQDRQRTLPPPAGAKPSGTLELHLEVGIGQVEVTRAAS
ncbi:PspC domain-containing protein [Streptomyces sp. NBC_01142]|uniref:PspC domain-containing protein n=1 Tax=Streptomyces sp. NBC_01142 TaxID=2975865 RepID=UPI0022571793|nr:PspC domain-containing protein [Streptomyces sp. NBC_01142]MCX4818821.1 PspC domain-containing protein [Streptomyces sp. NBC_01142]